MELIRFSEEDDTYHRDCELFEVDVKSRLDGTTAGYDATALQGTLDGAQGVVYGTLHLVQAEVVGTPQDDRGRGVDLGALDKDTLIVGYPLLDDFLGMSQVGSLELLVTVEVREGADQGSAGGLGNTSQIFLLATADGHGTLLDEELENHVVDTLGGEDDVGTGLEDHLHTLEDNARFPLTDFLQLIGVVNCDLDAKLHSLLLQVHVQASNLRIGYPGLHGLGSDGAVEGIAVDENGFATTLSVSLEKVDSLHGVLDLVPLVGGLDLLHGIDDHVGIEIGIGADDLAGHGRLGDVDQAVLSKRLNLCGNVLVHVLDSFPQS